MTKMIEATKNLNQRSEFNPFSVIAPIPDIEYFSSRNFLCFQSTKLALDQLLVALQDNDIRMIGLYGMGGSGKTTLVKEVGKVAKERNIFDRVVFVTVSQTPNITKIQDEIADMLSLILPEKSEAGRARRLSISLSSGERILVILDDVWSMINLEDVGIPFEEYLGCKILLTTRRQQVCNMMDCDRKVPLHLLSNEESWTLFQKHAHIVNESLDSVAREIVRECKGLPIAIQAVGASLKRKSMEEWKEALGRLTDSRPINEDQGVRDAFSCLKLSYDYLTSNEAKSLFLMCCMYPEDADIPIEDLFRITIGLGMFEELSSLEKARNKVSSCINNLVDSCLLMHSEKKKNHLKIHDTVRDVALWISSQKNCTIVVNLEKDIVVANGLMKECYGFTSWCNQTTQFPQRLDAPKLEILLLVNIGACELSEANFRGMGALKVMQIDSKYYRPIDHLSLLPYSLNLLTNLRTLRLQKWQLGDDLSWVLALKRLEVLDLKYSSFKDLPQGLEELSELKLLDLSMIKEQSFKIIERCTQLQELYTSEIQLSRTTLKLGKCLSNDTTFPRLKRYELKVGNFASNVNIYSYDALVGCHSKVFSLREVKIFALSPFVKDLIKRAEAVHLYRLDGGCKNIVPNIVQVVGRLNELTNLWLHSCLDLEFVADATSHHTDLFQVENLVFPKLIMLKMEHLANLKEIWRGPPLLGFFEKLQELYICDCPILVSLFPKSIARTVLSLQKMTIHGCSELKNIIEEDGDGADNEIISASSNNAYLVFSNMNSLTITSCDKLEYIFSNSCAQGLDQLEEMLIYGPSKLKYVFGQREYEHQPVQIKLPFLKSIKLRGLENLLSIFPENFHSSCPCLRELHWHECPKFEASCVNIMAGPNTIMDNQFYSKTSAPLLFLNFEALEIGSCGVDDTLFPLEKEVFTERNSHNKLISPLSTLRLNNLLELKFIWCGPLGIISLQNLRRVTVSGCNNLRTIFSPVIFRSMPLLEDLEISDCSELEEIMSGAEVGEQHQGPLNVQSTQICFPKLKRLEVQRCKNLTCLFSVAIDWSDLPENVFPNLMWLTLIQVPSLKELFQCFSLSSNCLPQLLGSKLVQLRLGGLSEVWLKWRAPSHISNLVHLQTLIFNECNKLKSVFGEGIQIRSIPMLACLIISNCEELEEVLTQDNEYQTLCFPKLGVLRVHHCNKLKRVFSISSITILLPRLAEMDISECAELEELFGRRNEDSIDNTTNEIVLTNLQCIRLTKLPSLDDVCKGFRLSAENALYIVMQNCPKFSSIMGATGNVVIHLSRKEAEPQANNSSQQLDQLPYFHPSMLTLKELELQELSESSCIVKAFTSSQNMSFQYLYSPTVHGCGTLKCIFSMSVWGSLPQLRSLEISECEELEEITQDMEEDHHNLSNNPNMELPLPQLQSITVKGCHKLKCLFRTRIIGMLLPDLRQIELLEAARIEELFSHNTSHQGIVTSLELVLPNLCSLKLSKLPALTHFCKASNLNAPLLQHVQINECPNFDFSIQRTDDESSDGEQ